jgi:hypothetical protein
MSITNTLNEVIRRALKEKITDVVVDAIIMNYLQKIELKFFCKIKGTNDSFVPTYLNNEIHIIGSSGKSSTGHDCKKYDHKILHTHNMKQHDQYVDQFDYDCYITNFNNKIVFIRTFPKGSMINYVTYNEKSRWTTCHSSSWPIESTMCRSIALSDKYTFVVNDVTIFRKEHYLNSDDKYVHIGYMRGKRTKTSRRINHSMCKDEKVIRLLVVDTVLFLITNHKIVCYTFDLKKKYTMNLSDKSERIITACSNNKFIFVLVEKDGNEYISMYKICDIVKTHMKNCLFNTIKIFINDKIKNDFREICASNEVLYTFTNDSKVYVTSLEAFD